MSRRRPELFVTAVFCVLFLTAGVGLCSGDNTPSDVNDANGPPEGEAGPTVRLGYDERTIKDNPASSFMYFVPLISPTLVEIEISKNNRQLARIISFEKKITSESFFLSCEFEMLGEGYFKTVFSAAEVIDMFVREQDKDEPMTNILDYIEFEGEGFGRIEARGKITGSAQTVTEVVIYFDARGRKSPVTIGLYDIKPLDGRFEYENKYNELVARIASLTFRRCQDKPKMEVKLVSVNKARRPNGFVGKVKGTIANWFLNPVTVSSIGNETMLDFGLALLKERPTFTFPRADNIKESRTVAINDNQ